MPSTGLCTASPIGSARSSAVCSSSAPAGTNWRALGSSGSPGSISASRSGVTATAKRAATASISARRSGATTPAAARSRAVRAVLVGLVVMGHILGGRVGGAPSDPTLAPLVGLQILERATLAAAAQVELLDVLVVRELGGGAVEHDLAVL